MGSANTKTAIALPDEVTSSVTRPNVYEYTDYKEFLKDQIDYLRQTKKLSIRKLAKLSDFSNTYLVLVLSGKRPLSENAFLKITPHLALRKNETSFLEKLRLSEVAPNQEAKHAAVLELKNHSKYKTSSNREFETLEYLKDWHHIAIRELTSDPDFTEDPAWIQKKLAFKVSRKEIRESLKFLEDSEFLIRNKDGRLKSLEKKLMCVGKILKHSIRAFHQQMLSLALKSIDHTDPSERLILGSTVYVGEEQIDKIREKILILQNEILDLEKEYDENSGKKGKVYHVELAGFPLTDPKKRKAQ